MGNCCAQKPDFEEEIRSIMSLLYAPIPNLNQALLLRPDGEIIAALPGGIAHVSEELATTITTFRKTAATFGSALQQQQQFECPTIHIQGSKSIFSCYDVDRHVLALFMLTHGLEQASPPADEDMVGILDQIREKLHDYAPQRTRRKKKR